MEKATTIEAANKNIINLLADAGPDGLHEDDVLYLLGFPDKKSLNMRLRDLKGRSQITDLEGGRWKKLDTAMNGSMTEHTTATFITPSLTEELPTVNLPGEYKFSSYKNTLQEYCQKKHMPVPKYSCSKEQHGLIGMVTFALNHVRCEVVCGSLKEAEARAAYEALQKLGYLKEHKFDISVTQTGKVVADNNNTNNTNATTNGHQTPPVNSGMKTKTGIKGHITFKMLLNEYAQKTKLSAPVYNTETVNNSAFSSTCIFNETSYKCLAVYKRQKDAEQNAAQVALTAVLEFSPEELKRKEVCGDDYAETVGKKVKKDRVDGTGKSMLNEHAQKNKFSMPTYVTVATNGGFFSTVTFNGKEYKSIAMGAKRKDAEQSAAQVALNKLTGLPLPDGQPMAIGELDVSQMISEQRLLTQPISLKNRLQEYCQRLGKTLPKYTTIFLGDEKFHQSTVEVQGIEYRGLPQKAKKNAETAAAEEALRALELMI